MHRVKTTPLASFTTLHEVTAVGLLVSEKHAESNKRRLSSEPLDEVSRWLMWAFRLFFRKLGWTMQGLKVNLKQIATFSMDNPLFSLHMRFLISRSSATSTFPSACGSWSSFLYYSMLAAVPWFPSTHFPLSYNSSAGQAQEHSHACSFSIVCNCAFGSY